MQPSRQSPTAADLAAQPKQPDDVYNYVFWLAFAANLTMVAANSLTFRFAELVVFLGGTEQTTGEIVRAGMFGAIACRWFLGRWLDHYGTRRVWLLSTLLFAGGGIVFMFCREISWTIYVARIAFACGIAGMSTAGIVHVQNLVPAHRRTEVIGNFGSSGFLGMVLGSQIADLIFYLTSDGFDRFHIMFGLVVALAVGYVVLVLLITNGDEHSPPERTPGPLPLLRQYWPGMILAVAMVMGVSFTVTSVFLTRMVTERGLGGIGMFFLAYCTAAFVFRVASSRWDARFGSTNLVLMGLCGHAAGHLLLAQATAQWHLIFPAISAGFGHALLFPSVVSLGAGTFPRKYRGTGTTLVLGFTELGVAASAPLLGWIIDWSRDRGFEHPFRPMFYASASTAFLVTALYAWSARRTRLRVQAEDRRAATSTAPIYEKASAEAV
jgi:MFS family permease